MENYGFSRFPKVSWEIRVSISSNPPSYVQAYRRRNTHVFLSRQDTGDLTGSQWRQLPTRIAMASCRQFFFARFNPESDLLLRGHDYPKGVRFDSGRLGSLALLFRITR